MFQNQPENKMPQKPSLENAAPPWGLAIAQILTPLLPSPSAALTEGEYALALQTLRGWEMGLHWMIKTYWKSKHPLPVRQSLIQQYRAHGDLLHEIRQLAVQCHADQQTVGAAVPFPHAAAWYAAVVREIVSENVLAAIAPIEALVNTRRKKEAIAALAMQPWLALGRCENPVNQQKMPATWLLYQVAIALAEDHDLWRKDHFRRYCAAGRTWAKATNGAGWAVASFDQQGRAIASSGADRSSQIVPLPAAFKK